jgi:diacylglycerol kinase family enzyme
VITHGSAPPPPPPATVTITSDPPGAEIELDGTFIGNTPTTLQMAPGSHSFLMKKGSATWTRTVQIQPGGTIPLSAPLSGKK